VRTCALTLSMFLCHATMVQDATAGDGTPSWTSLVNLHSGAGDGADAV
jgi:hypothetical protein